MGEEEGLSELRMAGRWRTEEYELVDLEAEFGGKA